MIPVQHGPGGWVNSRSAIARIIAIVSVGLMLAMAGCSSKKPAAVGDTNPGGANGLGENGTGAGGGTSLEGKQHVFHSRFAGSPGRLARHSHRIVLQEREEVEIDAQVRRIEGL